MTPLRFAHPALAWLVLLHWIFVCIRAEGATRVASQLDSEVGANALFALCPQADTPLPRNFALILLDYFCAADVRPDDIDAYFDAVLHAHPDAGAEETVSLRLIRRFIWTACCGYAPWVCAEFARQTLPPSIKPCCAELREILAATRQQLRAELKVKP